MNKIKLFFVKRIIKKEMATLKLSNFTKANTPKLAETIGNISLILAVIAAIPVALASAGVTVPPTVVAISIYATTGGSVVKAISKLFGIKQSE
jgi:hypothetical protein